MQLIAEHREAIEQALDGFVEHDDHYTVLLEYLKTIELHPGCSCDEDRWYVGGFLRILDKSYIIFDIAGHDLQEPRYAPLKLFWKYTFLLLLLGKTHLEVSPARLINNTWHSRRFIKFLADKDICVLGQHGDFKDATYITEELVEEFINEIAMLELSNWTKQDALWFVRVLYDIKALLPSYFRVRAHPFKGAKVSSIFPIDQEDEDQGYQPIASEIAMPLLKGAIDLIERYSEDILVIHGEMVPILSIKNSRQSKIVNAARHLVFGWGRSILSRKYMRIEKLCDLLVGRFGTEMMETQHPFYENWKYAVDFKCGKIPTVELYKRTSLTTFTNAVRALAGACYVLILYPTGMRRSEFYELKNGCAGVEEASHTPLLEVIVYKTAEYAEGEVIRIPVPELTTRAVRVLERLSRQANPGGKSEYLIDQIMPCRIDYDATGRRPHINIIAGGIRKLCEWLEIDQSVHPHQFRKSIAAFFIERTQQAPVLLKMLFRHKSLTMTLAYLRRNPLVRRAQRDLFISMKKPLVNAIIDGLVDGRIAGTKGDRMKAGIQEREQFQGKTGEQLREELESYFVRRLGAADIGLFLTPLCICVRPYNNNKLPPCASPRDGDNPYYASLPRTDNCKGAQCKDALFTRHNLAVLEPSLEFYRSVLEQKHEEYRGNIYLMDKAKSWVRLYEPIVSQLKGEGA